MKWAFGIVVVFVAGAVSAFAIYTFGLSERGERAVATTARQTPTAPRPAQLPKPSGRIAYVALDGSLHRMRADGTERERIPGTASFGWASWSASGDELAFVTLEPPGSTFSPALIVASGAGARSRAVSMGTGAIGYVALSPDGVDIAFLHSPTDETLVWDLAIGNEPSGLIGIFTNYGDLEGRPSWSGRGELAFTRDLSQSTGVGKIYVIGDDGRDTRYVARGADPSWSPNGTDLAFTGPNHTIWRQRVGTTKPTLLARNGTEPVWSPDGNWIAFKRETNDCSEAGCFFRIQLIPAISGPTQPVGPKIFDPGQISWTR